MFSDTTPPKLYFGPLRGGGGYKAPIPPQTPPTFLFKTTDTKSYIITETGGTAINVAPEVDVITDCDALRIAAETEKEIESGHDEHSLRGEGSPRMDPL